LGRRLGGLPVVVITTVGRKTGKRRPVALAVPVETDRSLLVVASDGGAADHPQWYLNMCASPTVKVLRNGRTQVMRARVAAPDERAELWSQVVARNPVYAGYQRKTAREIPLVWLDATDSSVRA
jgi:deazaflavin-dependent oxidoreductase (nitroreductase family)